jgi:hypothetical protein
LAADAADAAALGATLLAGVAFLALIAFFATTLVVGADAATAGADAATAGADAAPVVFARRAAGAAAIADTVARAAMSVSTDFIVFSFG